MKRTLLIAALLLFAGSTSLTAQNGYGWGNRGRSWQRPNHNSHYDRYRDYGRDRDIRQDQREIDYDRWGLLPKHQLRWHRQRHLDFHLDMLNK